MDVKNVFVPSMSLIPWKRLLISFGIALEHFGLSDKFTRCLYYWTLTVSGQIDVFICPGWMVTSPVLVSLIDQYYPVWLVVMVEGAGIGSLRGGMIVVALLAMMAWPLSSHTLVLYLCTLGKCLG